MRIVIDLQSCQTGSRLGGIGRYSMALAKEMIRQSRGHEFWIVLNGLIDDGIVDVYQEFSNILPIDRIKIVPLFGPVAEAEKENEQRFHISALIREYYINSLQPDFVFISSLFEGLFEEAVTTHGLLSSDHMTAVTLYDLIPLVEKDIYLKEQFKYKWYKNKIEYLVKSNLKLAISEYSRQEGIELLGLGTDDVVNISSAIDKMFKRIDIRASESDELLLRHNIHRKFLFYTGSFDQRKNHENLIKAYATLPKNIRNNHQLVVTGNGWEGAYRNLHNLANSVGISQDELIFTGHVSDQELVQLYNLCSLFVFPSIKEGFGLPALEAMSCGAPTIGSNVTSIPEVIGIKDALFDPLDYKSIGNKIKECLTDDGLYNKLLENAKTRSKIFSWKRSAIKTLDAFENIIQRKKENRRKNKSRSAKFSNGEIGKDNPNKQNSNQYYELIQKIAACQNGFTSDEKVLKKLSKTIAYNTALIEAEQCFEDRCVADVKVGWVTTWNCRCGIATYSESLIEKIPSEHWVFAPFLDNPAQKDKKNVVRSWSIGPGQYFDDLTHAIDKKRIDVLVIQFNYGFYEFHAFSNFLKVQIASNRPVFIILHSTKDPCEDISDKKLSSIKEDLECCTLLVHKKDDLERLKAMGLKGDIKMLPHGMYEGASTPKMLPGITARFVLSTYGFALPNKGLTELVEAFNLLIKDMPDLHLLMVNAEYDVPESAEYIRQIKALVNHFDLDNNITMITDFLPNKDSLGYLRLSDMVVIPYQSTNESASGSARMALASGKLVAVTPIPMFEEMREAVCTLPGTKPQQIAEGISRYIKQAKTNPEFRKSHDKRARLWISANSFRSVGKYLFSEIMQAIEY